MRKITVQSIFAGACLAASLLCSCQNIDNPKEGDKAVISAGDAEFEMIYVEPGDFRMGATAEQKGTDRDELPAHDVKLTKGYWIGRVEVTQEQWMKVMNNNPSSYKGQDGKEDLNLPVNGVTWAEAQAFVKKLSELSGYEFRLPTEAEWEFAARGGHKADGIMYSGSIYVENVACCERNSKGVPSPVGMYMPNKLDLRDMSGNVAEYVADNYEAYKDSMYVDPLIVTSDTLAHVVRGGSFNQGQTACRTASRESVAPLTKSVTVGLRVAMSPVK